MEIRQLEYFLTVKNAGSFTRAAEHLYVSQPAVTSAIRSLESELGITLFDRSQGKASLTAEGRIFSAHVEEIMKGVVTTIRDMDAMKSLSSGTLAIGISSFLSLPSVLSLIARFLSDHPGIECRVQEGPAEAVAALLEKANSTEPSFPKTLAPGMTSIPSPKSRSPSSFQRAIRSQKRRAPHGTTSKAWPCSSPKTSEKE